MVPPPPLSSARRLPSEFDVPFLFHIACVQKRPNLQQHIDGSNALRFYSAKNQSPQEVDRKINEAYSAQRRVVRRGNEHDLLLSLVHDTHDEGRGHSGHHSPGRPIGPRQDVVEVVRE